VELVVIAQSAEEAVRSGLVVCTLLVTGCNQIFGLGDVKNTDAPDPYVGCTRPGDPTYHDEDGDLFPDDCDNCPGIANPGQEDLLEIKSGQPADGVGDACDPAPAITGDKIARFISFSAAGDAALIEPHAGSWGVANGELAIDSTATQLYADASFAVSPPARPYAVETHAAFDKFGNAATLSYNMGVFTNYRPGMGAAGRGECEIDRVWNGTSHDDEVLAGIGNGGIPQILASTHFGDGAGYVSRSILRPATLDCQFFGDLADNAATSGSGVLTDGKIGFEVRGVAVRFQYVVVYDMSGEP
jgi:hypothetical protein